MKDDINMELEREWIDSVKVAFKERGKARITFGEAALIWWFWRVESLPDGFAINYGQPAENEIIALLATKEIAGNPPMALIGALNSSVYFNCVNSPGHYAGCGYGRGDALQCRPNDRGRQHFECKLKPLLLGLPKIVGDGMHFSIESVDKAAR